MKHSFHLMQQAVSKSFLKGLFLSKRQIHITFSCVVYFNSLIIYLDVKVLQCLEVSTSLIT